MKTEKMDMKKHMRRFLTTLSIVMGFMGFVNSLHAQINDTVVVGCLPAAAYRFTLTNPPANPISVCWDLADGNGFVCNNLPIAQGVYSTAGLKNIICRVETTPGVFSTFNHSITVNASPNAAFSINDPNLASCGSTITRVFSLANPNNVNRVVWEVTNVTTGILINRQTATSSPYQFTQVFSASGNFRVKVVVFDNTGCVNELSQNYTVTINRPITGNFSSSLPFESCLPAAYSFTPNLSIPTGVVVDSAIWTLTSMTGTTPPPPQVFYQTNPPTANLSLPTFTTPGEYQISLRVIAQGCTSSIPAPFPSFKVDNPPTLSFTFNGGRTASAVCLNQIFDLQNNTNTTNNLPGGTFTWDFFPSRPVTAPGGAPTTGLFKFRYTNVPLDSNSIILRWNGACKAVDTLKKVLLTKGPLARIALRNPYPPVSCDSPFVFEITDSVSWKPANGSTSFTHRWYRYAANGILITDSVDGVLPIFRDTISVLGERRWYQVRFLNYNGCEDLSTKISVQRAVPEVTITAPSVSCDNPIIDPKSLVPNPGSPIFIYKFEVYQQGNPSNIIATAGPSNYNSLPPIVLSKTSSLGANITNGGNYTIRVVMGINPTLSACTDTDMVNFTLASSNVELGRLVGGSHVPNNSGGCLTGGTHSATFNSYEDLPERFPANNTIASYAWSVTGPNGPVTTLTGSTTPTLSATFNEVGVFTVSLLVTTTQGCTITRQMQYEVGTVATINATPNAGDTLIVCKDADITSVSASGSQGSSFTYQWAVYNATPAGQGTVVNTALPTTPVTVSNLTDFNPTFKIKTNNPYYFVVTVTNDKGCTATNRILVKGSSIVASYRVSDSVLSCPGYKTFLSYNFDAISFDWEFTDPIGNAGNPLVTNQNNPSPLDSATAYFGIGGNKTVRLVVTSQYGCTDTTSFNLKVGGPIPFPFVSNPTSKRGCDSLTVTIQDRSTNIENFLFSWGDGSSNYNLSATNSHTYKYPYSIKNDSLVKYAINMFAIGQNCVVTYTDTITVYPRPVVSGFVLSDSLCSPASFDFNDTSRFAPNGTYGAGTNNTIYSWNFNDGTGWNTQTAPLPSRNRTKSMATPGIYNVLLAITNPWGCVDTNRLARVRVLDTPVANFYAVDSVKCWANGSNGFIFNDASTYTNSTATNWRWYWSDPTAVPNAVNGYTTTGPSTGAVNFTVPGSSTNVQHTIRLVVTNAFGCADSVAKPNYITVRDTIPLAPISPTFITVDPLTLRNHVEINWRSRTSPEFLNYEIFRNNTSVATITNSTTTSYTDVIDVVNAGTSLSYKMRVNDVCNQPSSFDTTHSTIKVSVNGVATGGYATNNISFNAYEAWGAQTSLDYYEVFRKKGTNGVFAPIGRVAPVVGNTNYLYVDSGLCADTFYYYVKALHKNYPDPRFGYYSISNYDSIVANFSVVVTPVEINYVTVEANNKISLAWTPAPLATGVLKNYIVERKDATNPVSTIIYRGTATTFSDVTVDASSKVYQYIVRYEDQCGNLSNSSDTSVNILATSSTVKIANYDAYDMKIDWTPYATWKNGVIRYDVEVKYPTGWRTIGSVPGNALTFIDVNVPRNEIDGAYCYRVKAIENDATPDSSFSNETCINYPSKILIPTAFTPNGDLLNDTLFINGAGLKAYDFRVYDRWGKCVFQSTDITEGWNGRLQNTGDPCQSGIYSYILIAKGQDFKRYNQKGIITLLK